MIGKVLLGVLIGAGIGAAVGYFGKCSSGACPLTANPYRGALWGALLGSVFAFAMPGVPKSQPERPTGGRSGQEAVTEPTKHGPVHINSKADFNTRVLEAGGICLVDLFSNRCPPCRALDPIVSSLAGKYAGKAIVCKVDVDRLPFVAGRYRVSAIPTVLIIKDGKLLKRLVGLRRQAEYSAILDKLLNEEQPLHG